MQWQHKTKQPWSITERFPAAKDAPKQHMVQVNWLVNDDQLSDAESLALNMLDHLLMGTSAAPLRKALTESQLGTAPTGGGLHDELLQATYSVGLKGVEPANASKVEPLVTTTLHDLATSGFDSAAIDASLNSIEFSLREFNTGRQYSLLI